MKVLNIDFDSDELESGVIEMYVSFNVIYKNSTQKHFIEEEVKNLFEIIENN